MDSHGEEGVRLLSEDSIHNSSDNETRQESGISQPSNPRESCQSFEPTVYKRRWWILMVFVLYALAQGHNWNSLTPLSNALQIALDWSVQTIAAVIMSASVVAAIVMVPFTYLIQAKGLRVVLIISSSALVIQCALWIIAAHTEQVWLFVVGSMSNGLAICLSYGAGAYISVLWFPVSQRTTATAIASIAVYVGVGLPFLTGPNIVGVPVTPAEVKYRNVTTDYVTTLKKGIYNTVYFDTGLAVLIFVLTVAYFPSKPPKPPSRIQTIEREGFSTGLKLLLKNPQYWILSVAYNIVNGSFISWLPFSVVNLRSLNVDEAMAGWIAFTATLSGGIGSICVSVVADKFKRKTKTFIKIMTFSAAVLYALLACLQERYILVDDAYITGLLFGLYIALSLCINGAIPLYYELACEYAYPVHEALACTLLVLVNCVFNSFFFTLYLIPALRKDSAWMTWTCLGTCVICLPLLMVLKDRYHRLDLDNTERDA